MEKVYHYQSGKQPVEFPQSIESKTGLGPEYIYAIRVISEPPYYQIVGTYTNHVVVTHTNHVDFFISNLGSSPPTSWAELRKFEKDTSFQASDLVLWNSDSSPQNPKPDQPDQEVVLYTLLASLIVDMFLTDKFCNLVPYPLPTISDKDVKPSLTEHLAEYLPTYLRHIWPNKNIQTCKIIPLQYLAERFFKYVLHPCNRKLRQELGLESTPINENTNIWLPVLILSDNEIYLVQILLGKLTWKQHTPSNHLEFTTQHHHLHFFPPDDPSTIVYQLVQKKEGSAFEKIDSESIGVDTEHLFNYPRLILPVKQTIPGTQGPISFSLPLDFKSGFFSPEDTSPKQVATMALACSGIIPFIEKFSRDNSGSFYLGDFPDLSCATDLLCSLNCFGTNANDEATVTRVSLFKKLRQRARYWPDL